MDDHHDTSWTSLIIMAIIFLVAFGGVFGSFTAFDDITSTIKTWDKQAKASLVIVVVFAGIALEKLFRRRKS